MVSRLVVHCDHSTNSGEDSISYLLTAVAGGARAPTRSQSRVQHRRTMHSQSADPVHKGFEWLLIFFNRTAWDLTRGREERNPRVGSRSIRVACVLRQ